MSDHHHPDTGQGSSCSVLLILALIAMWTLGVALALAAMFADW